MSPKTARLLREALQLSPEERVDLAGSLLKSLDEREDQQAEAAWQAEILQRIQELDSGAVKPIPWSEARRLLDA